MTYETPQVDDVGKAEDVVQGAGGHFRDADRSLTLGLDIMDTDE
jgi:hypothetical protein